MMARATEYSVDLVARLDGFADRTADEHADTCERLLESLAGMGSLVMGAIAFVEHGGLGARFNLLSEDAYQALREGMSTMQRALAAIGLVPAGWHRMCAEPFRPEDLSSLGEEDEAEAKLAAAEQR